MVAMLATALLCYYIYPDGWSWNTALIYGAITAATDPVSIPMRWVEFESRWPWLPSSKSLAHLRRLRL